MTQNNKSDYYGVLGVSSSASEAEIRAQFRELVRQRHPDRRSDVDREQAIEEFQYLTQAANALMDPQRRVEYDQSRRTKAFGKPVEQQAIDKLLQRGVNAFREGSLKLAIDSLEEATRIGPKDARAWHFLAQVASRIPAKKSLGVHASRQAVDLDPRNPKYLVTAGRAHLEIGRVEAARRFLADAQKWGAEPVQIRPLLDQLRKRQ